MNVKLLTEHHLEFLILKGGCTGSSESTLVKIPHWWKSHVTAHVIKFKTAENYIKISGSSAAPKFSANNAWVKVQNFQNPEFLKFKF